LSGQLLDGPRRRSAHREMRTEGVSQDVDARSDVGAARRPSHQALDLCQQAETKAGLGAVLDRLKAFL
jgi:hypothetical protein